MSKISKETWAEIQDCLSKFMTVVFKVDGHELTCKKRFVSENRTAILVFIDNGLQGMGSRLDDEDTKPICKKAWRISSRSIYKQSEITRIEKAFGKREAKKTFPKLHEKVHFLMPDYATSKSFVAKFKKLDGLELVTDLGAGSNKGA